MLFRSIGLLRMVVSVIKLQEADDLENSRGGRCNSWNGKTLRQGGTWIGLNSAFQTVRGERSGASGGTGSFTVTDRRCNCDYLRLGLASACGCGCSDRHGDCSSSSIRSSLQRSKSCRCRGRRSRLMARYTLRGGELFSDRRVDEEGGG